MAEFSKRQQDAAYRAAEQAIEKARAAAATNLNFSGKIVDQSGSDSRVVETGFAALTRLPEQIATLTSLQTLWLDGTQVSDLAPLAALAGLRRVSLTATQVSELSPLATLTGLQELSLHRTQVRDLTSLSALTGLQTIWLDRTQVKDLAPLAAMTGLRTLSLTGTKISDLRPLADLRSMLILWLDMTQVSDVAPLANLTNLHRLVLDGTQVGDIATLAALTGLTELTLTGSAVRDLRPLLALKKLGTGRPPGLAFVDTPATRADPTLHDLSQIDDPKERAEKTLAYLRTLPPWPESLDTLDGPILTVKAVLKSQSPLGWRFSPTDGAMQVYADAAPTTAMQEQLARMSSERAQALKKVLAGANHGLRGEALQEATRFADLMDDGSRPLSVRSVELWGSLVALGGLLEGNDVGRVQGRDPLDLLSVEQRAALQTLLQIAGNFVRSYPDVKALDDSAGGFLRRSITVEMVGAMIEAALRAAYVTPGSAALMQHVAAIGGTEGAQADKAASVSVRGIANLIQTAALFVGKGSIKLAGAAALGAAGYVGKEAADHYDLDKAAFAYFELIRDKVGPFLSNMPPDEAAVLQSALNDAAARLNERARLSTMTDDPEAHEQGRKRDGNPSTGLNRS